MSVLLFSFLSSFVLVLIKLLAPDMVTIQGWVSQMLATTFFGGLCVFMIGIRLEYISIMLARSHGKPLFFAVDRSSDEVLRSGFKVEVSSQRALDGRAGAQR